MVYIKENSSVDDGVVGTRCALGLARLKEKVAAGGGGGVYAVAFPNLHKELSRLIPSFRPVQLRQQAFSPSDFIHNLEMLIAFCSVNGKKCDDTTAENHFPSSSLQFVHSTIS